ncbi:alpha/beta hydrolase [Corynebacterium lowii]|uniref:Pyrethroid hydrolase n=1 Tax=Corynebacterium lowii TaxID=1544413 RepID=A0A0Q0YV25_9CORY|nr:alpha/beta hydrolase [Corynebacterium lowii]KQB86171.1 Pyrethroid hydrolase [Corynebacterium lowii]MDP9852645.1 pimeloyl-ACP methyl ester carboxylesterase [Corynebacterium lowii]
MTQTIVFVHGFMTTGDTFSEWVTFFEQRGYTCHAPTWVGHTHNDAPEERAKITLSDVLKGYTELIDSLPEKPILIGHSLGGVIVQKLLEQGYGSMAVCLTSGPPKGIAAFNKDWLVSNGQMLNPLDKKPLVLMPPTWYHKYVTNEMSYEETVAFMDQHCIESSKLVAKSIGEDGVIDFTKPHPPILFIAGSKDRSQPAIINQKNHQAYTDAGSVCDYEEFAGRTHNIVRQTGWEEVAGFIQEWITRH